MEGNGIRQIQPIRPSLPSVANNQKVSKYEETDEQKLKNALFEGLKPKKQLVSIGVQSPDFMALTPQKGLFLFKNYFFGNFIEVWVGWRG